LEFLWRFQVWKDFWIFVVAPIVGSSLAAVSKSVDVCYFIRWKEKTVQRRDPMDTADEPKFFVSVGSAQSLSLDRTENDSDLSFYSHYSYS